jgi:hypothetical protein
MMIRSGVAAVCALAGGVSGADVIFDSFNHSPSGTSGYYYILDFSLGEANSSAETAGGFEDDRRVGQAITFAPGPRFVTEVRVQFTFGFQAGRPTFATTLTIFQNDGGVPGDAIWSGSVAGILAPPQGTFLEQAVTFHPNTTLPDSVFYALSIDEVTPTTRHLGPGFTQNTTIIGALGGPVMVQKSGTGLWVEETPGSAYYIEASFTAEGQSCYANCDGSTQAPVLNVADFTCFLQRFAAGDTYANCDNSTTAPTLNVADFTCFLQQFAAGCP